MSQYNSHLKRRSFAFMKAYFVSLKLIVFHPLGTIVKPKSSSYLVFFLITFFSTYILAKTRYIVHPYTEYCYQVMLYHTVQKLSLTEYNLRDSFTEESKCLPVNPCKSGGICTEDLSGYKCNCKDGYNGINCEGIKS